MQLMWILIIAGREQRDAILSEAARKLGSILEK